VAGLTRDDLWHRVEAYRDAWVAHDLDGLLGLVTPDVVFHNYTAGERVEGAENFREHVHSIVTRWPDTRFAERRVHVGDDFACVEWTARATRADGRTVEWDGLDILEFRDEWVSANYVYSTSAAPRVLEDA